MLRQLWLGDWWHISICSSLSHINGHYWSISSYVGSSPFVLRPTKGTIESYIKQSHQLYSKMNVAVVWSSSLFSWGHPLLNISLNLSFWLGHEASSSHPATLVPTGKLVYCLTDICLFKYTINIRILGIWFCTWKINVTWLYITWYFH